jgi:serine/threonine protein phosphatase 1
MMEHSDHYIIGDVHGEYDLLLALVKKLPKNAKLIFVGDLVNRGKQSKEVVEFVRKNAYAVVKGNHEGYLIEHAKNIIQALEQKPVLNLTNLWSYIGGVQMLWSYKLLKRAKDGSCQIIRNQEGIDTLKSDLEWIKNLPLCLELGEFENYHLPIVISHGSIGDYWGLKETNKEHFEIYSLSNRTPPSKFSPIFNIYGHEVVPDVTIGENFVALDTGCGKLHDAKLSTYCLETREVIQASKDDIQDQT